MMSRSDDMRPVEPGRQLGLDECALTDRLLQESFPGRDEARSQLNDALVVAEGDGDTRTLVFAPPPEQCPRIQMTQRIPVEAIMSDKDGTDIAVLLHVSP